MRPRARQKYRDENPCRGVLVSRRKGGCDFQRFPTGFQRGRKPVPWFSGLPTKQRLWFPTVSNGFPTWQKTRAAVFWSPDQTEAVVSNGFQRVSNVVENPCRGFPGFQRSRVCTRSGVGDFWTNFDSRRAFWMWEPRKTLAKYRSNCRFACCFLGAGRIRSNMRPVFSRFL